MRVIVPHHTTKEKARKIVDKHLGQLLGQYGHYLSESQTNWDGDRLDFNGKAKGFSASGSVEITDTDVILDGKLPLVAKPFESRIKSSIEREAESIFGKAPS
jgi:putative polyhydroxyalkanoic acid system protein